ncbi:MAG: hypothetical protein A2Z31_04600 [candidate division NC10 bacterium RBG_16_65_8]|nr:MAG: hypothetical protein A2Z31_04600 [candidate division NC10 bacterium RBG_16_65_8]
MLLVGVGAALLARRRWRPALLAATMSGLILAAAGLVAPTAHGILQGALREFSQEAGRILQPGDPVVVYGLNAPSIVFYAERRVKPVGADAPGEVEAAVRGLVEAGRPAVVIARSNLVPRLNQMHGLALRTSRGGYALYVAPR